MLLGVCGYFVYHSACENGFSHFTQTSRPFTFLVIKYAGKQLQLAIFICPAFLIYNRAAVVADFKAQINCSASSGSSRMLTPV